VLVSYDTAEGSAESRTRITLRIDGREHTTTHAGGGPVEALTAALDTQGVRVDVISLHQTSVGSGADSDALTLLEHRTEDGDAWTAGRGRSVLSASLSAVITAANRAGAIGGRTDGD
jgi:2-isopropylmalate synthase